MTILRLFVTSLSLFISTSLFSQIIYITPDGTGDGSKSAPAGIEDAFANLAVDGAYFRLSIGDYNIDNELILSHNYMIVEGGFQPDKHWAKTSETNVTNINRSGLNSIGSSVKTQSIIGIQITDNLIGFTISDISVNVASPDASNYSNSQGYGVTAYGIKLNGCSYYTINRTVVDVGDGLSGRDVVVNNSAPSIRGDHGGDVDASGIGGFGAPGNIINGSNPPAIGGAVGVSSDQPTIDAEQLVFSTSTSGNHWQSFTPTVNGVLTKCRAFIEPNQPNIEIRIYEGEGTSGSILYSLSYFGFTGGASWKNFDIIQPVDLISGNIYTFWIENSTWSLEVANPYTGGRSSGSINWDYAFETTIAGRAANGADAIGDIVGGQNGGGGGAGGGAAGQDGASNTSVGVGGRGGKGFKVSGNPSFPRYGAFLNRGDFPSLLHGADGADGQDGAPITSVNLGMQLLEYEVGEGHEGNHGAGGDGGDGGGGNLPFTGFLKFSGGGGGAGGTGGFGGHGGPGGGGSFGIYATNNGILGSIRQCNVTSGVGGVGGLGGPGLQGGLGGVGGVSLSPYPGGNGGDGGKGGTGGTGATGPNGDAADFIIFGTNITPLELVTSIETLPIIEIEEPIERQFFYTLEGPTSSVWNLPSGITTSKIAESAFPQLFNNVIYDNELYSEFVIVPGSLICPSNTIIYVDENASGNGDGSSWTHAYNKLHKAIDVAHACPNVTDIYVAKGVYKPVRLSSLQDLRYATFKITKNLNIYGGFLGTEASPSDRQLVDGKLNPANYAKLSGDIANNDIYDSSGNILNVISDSIPDNVIHVMKVENISNQLLLDGIMITGGLAFGPGAFGDFDQRGGGILAKSDGSSNNIVYQNCIFQSNVAFQSGGAIFNYDNTISTFTNCEFVSNVSFANGAGVCNFAENAICESTFRDCVFEGNFALFGAGAGIYSIGYSGVSFNTFINSCIFSGNKSAYSSSSISEFSQGNLVETVILNSTFSGNERGVISSEGNCAGKLYNSILYGNNLNGISSLSGSAIGTWDIQNSIIQDMSPSGTIYNFDPIFTDPYLGAIPNTEGDYSIQLCSGSLDLGNRILYTNYVTDTFDFARNSRFQYGAILPDTLVPDPPNIDLGPWEVPNTFEFMASENETDAYVDLSWSVNTTECGCLDEDPTLKLGVTVSLKEGIQLINSWEVFKEDAVNGVYTFDYIDNVGPDITKDYILEFKKTGPGTLNCRRVARGSTVPFNAPVIFNVDNGLKPDSVNIQWNNLSSLTTGYNIYREGNLLKTINTDNTLGSSYSYDDVFKFEGNSFVNGESNEYCIETVSDIYFDIYGSSLPQQTCSNGSSYDINFDASDNIYLDKVEMTWADISAFADQIKITRDGQIIAVLESNLTSFDDLFPVYGKDCLYGVELVNNTIPFVGDYDNGMVMPNGIISGKVLSAQEKIPIKDVVITLEWTVSDTVQMSVDTLTDHLGVFSFDALFYGVENDFVITANKDTQLFDKNPLTSTLSLSDSEDNELVFLMIKDFEQAEVFLGVNSFDPISLPQEDLIRLDFDYNKTNLSDTVFFNIYRESDLIYQGVDDSDGTVDFLLEPVFDSTGVPSKIYNYTFHAFSIETNELIDTTLSSEITFPAVAPVQTFSATSAPNEGVVNLDWVHTSSNISGYRVYRYDENGRNKIYDGDLNGLTFTDKNGKPNSLTTYELVAYRNVNDIDYESLPNTQIVLYPQLFPVALSVQPLVNQDIVKLDFTPSVLYHNYEYQGVKIYRTHVTTGIVEIIDKINNELLTPGVSQVYNDKTGIPGELYLYRVNPFKTSSGIDFELQSSGSAVTFPEVSLPQNLSQETPAEGKIILTWNDSLSSKNINGSVVYKGLGIDMDSIGSRNYNEYEFIDYTNNPPNNSAETYHVATVRFVNGIRYLSNLVSILTDPPLVNGDDNFNLKNLTATHDQANHVKLCWEWCDPATQTPFVLRREGVVIDTLSFNDRSYYDYNAQIGVDIEYSIETPGVNNELTLQKKYVNGFIPAFTSVRGRAYKEMSKKGIVGASVQISIFSELTNDYSYLKTTTDSSGYYQLTNIPFLSGQDSVIYSIDIENGNSSFAQNAITFKVSQLDTIKNYSVDFIDLHVEGESEIEISRIDYFSLTPDPGNLAVQLSWSPENENYDGFEISRGTELLAEVLKGNSLTWMDEEGVPGVITTYAVRAFKILNSVRKYSEYKFRITTYPILDPVEFITATQELEQNRLMLNWSHPFDLHDLYTVTRNGIPFDIVNTGESLQIIDSIGIPGAFYSYEIIAWKGSIPSHPRSISISYSDVEPIRSFEITNDSIDLTLSGQDVTVSNVKFNYLKLNWIYSSGAADSFIINRFIVLGSNKFDEQILDRVGGEVFEYIDRSGIPDQLYSYEVIPVVYRDGQEYFAKRRDFWSESKYFPPLAPPYDFNTNVIQELGSVVNVYQVLDTFNDGQKILRNGEVIGLFPEVIDFYDNDGIPGSAYTYTISNYKKFTSFNGDEIEKESMPVSYNVTYPLPPTPQFFEATDGVFPNKISLVWNYELEVPIDYFEIERFLPGDAWESIAIVPSGHRTYDDFITGNDLPPDEYLAIEYRIKAVNKSIASSWIQDTGALYSGILTDGDGPFYRELGFDVDISGEWAVGGTQGEGVHIYRLLDDKTWALDSIITRPFENVISKNECFGCKVSISGKYIVVSARKANQGTGSIYIFERNNNNEWNLQQTLQGITEAPLNKDFGISLDVFDDTSLTGKDYIAIGSIVNNISPDLNEGQVSVYKRSGNQWNLVDHLNDPNPEAFKRFGHELSVFNKRLAIITFNKTIDLFTIESSSIVLRQSDNNPGILGIDMDDDQFVTTFLDIGLGIYISKVYSVDNTSFSEETSYAGSGLDIAINGDYFLMGTFSNTVKVGQHIGGNNYAYSDIVADPSCDSYIGFSLALSDEYFMVSSPNSNNNKGKIVFVPIQTIDPPVDVDATNGTQTGQVLVTWDEPSDLSQITSYDVFRDGEFLATVNSINVPGNTLSYTDLPSSGLIPGKHYVYQVESTYGSISSKSIGDEGWQPANGMISGQLTTLQGGVPVANALVTATLNVDGDYLEYNAITDNLGEYQISGIYYGESSIVTVSCSYLDHEIVSQTSATANPPLNYDEVELAVNNNTNVNTSFFDNTAYAISGTVSHMDIEDCYLDSIKITRVYSILQNGNRVRQKEEKFTNVDGEFTFIINPELAGLDSLLIEIDNVRYINEQNGIAEDSICFDFEGVLVDFNIAYVQSDHPDDYLYITDFSSLELNTRVAYEDKLLYPTTIEIINTCGDALLSSSENWTIRVESRDGCYEKYITTGSDGKTAFLEVPPIDLIYTVVDVSNKTLDNLVFLDYLINNSGSLQVDSVHINEAKNISQAELIERLTLKLEYHKPPIITPDFSEFSFLCDDPTRQAIIVAGDSYSVPISVAENFGTICSVTNGYLLVINAASNDPNPVRLDYIESLGGFENYSFVAGSPNPVVPHRWNLKIEYYSDSGIFQGEYSHSIFVKGSVNLPGNGILVDSSDDTDVIPLPLYILRDPPGDGSSATIKEGYSSTSTFSFSENIGGSAGVFANTTSQILGVGIKDEVNYSGGSYNLETKELSISTTTTKSISTSTSNSIVGRDASIIVGLGVAMQFGLVSTLEIECVGTDEGLVTETLSQGFTPIEVQTTFTYTVKFIEDLISGYDRQLDSIRSGQRVVTDKNGKRLTTEEAVSKFESLKNNWVEIINYFDNETNPLVHLTSTDFEDTNLFENISANNVEANKWRLQLLEDLGSGSPLSVDPDIILNQNQIDKYNNAASIIRELINAPSSSINSAWNFTTERYGNTNYYSTVGGLQPKEMADNLTFSGGTSQTFTYGQSKSFKTGNSRSSFFKTSHKIGVIFGGEVNIQIAPFGIGTETKALKADSQAGLKGEFSYTKNVGTSNSNTESQQISYTLGDNESLDEISTTIVRGIQPTHTPFFQVVGGKTRCPWEEGTLRVDEPFIQVLDPETGTPGSIASLFFQNPDELAEFTIRISNESATEDSRSVVVFLDSNTNPNGATIRLNGQAIGEESYIGLAPGVPLDLTLTVERGQAYSYQGLSIGIKPLCGSLPNIFRYVTLDVDFQSPCSPISIVKPNDNWLINGENRELILGLRDYEPSTPNFEDLTLEYRRLGAGVTGSLAFQSGWQRIPYTSIKESNVNNNPVLPSELAAYNMNNFGPGQTPTYFMVWEPEMGNAALFPDGEYELRVVSTCKEGTISNFTYSNVIGGLIDRSTLQIFGTPQPSDGVWVPGDEVSISFNKQVNCNLLNDPDFLSDSLRVYVSDTLVHNANFTCFNNKIIMTVPDFTIYDGETMTVSVEDIQDDNGNFAIKTDQFGNATTNLEWSFLVTTSKAYWEQDSIVVTLYEGDTIDVVTGIRNTEFQTPLNGIALSRATASNAWLGLVPNAGDLFNINPGAVRPIELKLIGESVGITYDTLTITNLPGSGTQPMLPIKLVTVKRPVYPPEYEFDTNQYPNSMTVVANYKFGDNGALSIDTLDQITVWIDEELRGLGRIEQSGIDHIAYLTVYGSSSDLNKTLEFRVWNQATDVEYNAHTDPIIQYSDNAFEGTTFSPRILIVDTLVDRARYIHLNQGYTWISFNSVVEDMSVENILAGIDNVTDGDRVLGQDGFIEYVSGAGWIADSNVSLDSFSTEKAYMVYLQNGPDSIRITGLDAPQFTSFLMNGTNWVGFPSQGNQVVEDAIGVNNLSDITQIKNKDISRLSDGSNWTSGQLLELKPNEGYKLFLSNLKTVTIPGILLNSLHDPAVPGLRSLNILADPNDASTWSVDLDDYAFTDVVPVVGRVLDDGVTILADGQKKIAAFINGELRGVGNIENFGMLSDDLFTLFIGKDDVDNNMLVQIYYFDGLTVSDSMMLEVSDLTVQGHGVYNYNDPLIWDIYCPQNLVLTVADSPLSGIYEASQVITIEGNVQVLNGTNVILNAPDVILNQVDSEQGAILEIQQTGCN